jgi:xanthine dehydrogenase accessory factor
MNSLFRALKERLTAGETVAFVSIIHSEGSTPRKAGALMLVGAQGRLCGTIGGSIAEYLAIEEGRRLIREAEDRSEKEFILHPNEINDIGAECGGRITVSFIRLDPKMSGVAAIVDNLIAQYETAAGIAYIFGGGHVGQETEHLLSRLDFCCVVYDDREEYSNPALFTPGTRTICCPFTALGKNITLSGDDYCVVLTHGHQSDYETFVFALKSPARYIGVIGSKRKLAFVRDRLKAAGFTHEQIHAPRVHAPIGLDIGSETPAEVAVSIAAEIIMVRKGRMPGVEAKAR